MERLVRGHGDHTLPRADAGSARPHARKDNSLEFGLAFPVGQPRARPVGPRCGGSEPGPLQGRRGTQGRCRRRRLLRRRRSAPPRPGSDLRLVRNLQARRLQRHQPSWCGAGGAAAAAANEPGTARGQQRAGQGRGPSDRAEGDDDAEEAEPGEGWGPGRARVGGGWGGVLVSWSRPKGRAAGIPWSRAGAPVRTREASSRRRRSSTTSCCPTPSGWTQSPTCSWPRSKATWAGQCSSKSCGPGASSGPGNSPRKCAGACRMGRTQRLGVKASAGGWGGGSLSAPDRWTLNSAPVRADRFCAVIPGSRPKPGKHSSFLPATFLTGSPWFSPALCVLRSCFSPRFRVVAFRHSGPGGA